MAFIISFDYPIPAQGAKYIQYDSDIKNRGIAKGKFSELGKDNRTEPKRTWPNGGFNTTYQRLIFSTYDIHFIIGYDRLGTIH